MHRAAFVLVLALTLPASALAQADEAEAPGVASAIQSRSYRLMNEIDVAVGALPLDPFTKNYFAQVSYTLHFTDAFAWQVGRGAYGLSFNTPLRDQLQRDFGVLRNQFDEVQFFVGSDLMWKPFYGKLSVLNKAVLHGELFLLLGATVFKFTNAFRPGVNVGGGVRVFINKNLSVRFDVTDNVVIAKAGTQTSIMNVMSLTLALGINFGGTE